MAQTIVSGVQHQLRRGSFAQMGFFTGAVGEVLFDTTYNRLAVQDGVLAGGYPCSMASIQPFVGAGTILPNVATAHINSLGGGYSLTLPSVSAYMPGQVLTVIDISNDAGTNTVTLNTASTLDKILSTAGVASTSITLNTNSGFIQLISNSSNKWVGVIKL